MFNERGNMTPVLWEFTMRYQDKNTPVNTVYTHITNDSVLRARSISKIIGQRQSRAWKDLMESIHFK